MVLEKNLEVPWNTRRSNQSSLKEINPVYSLEGLMLKLELQYFGHLIQTANLLEKTLILGKIEGRRIRGSQRMRQLDRSTNSVSMTLCRLWEINKGQRSLVCCSAWGQQRVGHGLVKHT